MLDGETRAQVTEEYRLHDRDTGSTELQIAVLTERIRHLTGHLRVHKKDVHSAGDWSPWFPSAEAPELPHPLRTLAVPNVNIPARFAPLT